MSAKIDEPSCIVQCFSACSSLAQREHGERVVSNPRISVVPISQSANTLRERGRDCCDHCSCRSVLQQLQYETGSYNVGSEGSLILHMANPAFPIRYSSGKLPSSLIPRCRDCWTLTPLENEDNPLTFRQSELTSQSIPVRNMELRRRCEIDLVTLVFRCATFSSILYCRLSSRVVQTRLENNSKPKFSLDTIDNSVNLMQSLQFAFLHETGHEVCELDPTLLRLENG